MRVLLSCKAVDRITVLMVKPTQQLYEQALKELRDRLVHELAGELEAVIVYGSVARKDADADSDIDVLIITPHKQAIYRRAFAISSEVDLHYETVTTLIFYTPEEFRECAVRGDPLLQEVLREGRAIYGEERFRSYQGALQIS